MSIPRRTEIGSVLRGRIQRALASRALMGGDRLPSTREVGAELNTDPRVVAAAYRNLADEGLVELKTRSGVYVARQVSSPAEGVSQPVWLAELLTEGIHRGISMRDLCDDLREAALARKLRVAVIAETYDQTAGLCRELRTDFGLDASAVPTEMLRRGVRLPQALRSANILVTTKALAAPVERLGNHLRKPSIVFDLRPSLFDDGLLAALKQRVFVIACDPRFLHLLRAYLATIPGADNVTMLIAGKDDLSVITLDAPAYVTQAARDFLGKTRIPGRLLPPVRTLSPSCIRAIVDVIVSINIAGRSRYPA